MNNKLYSWLRKSHSYNTALLHNEKKCGMHGRKHTEETKQKMRDSSPHISLKGIDSPSYGLKRTQETKDKISAIKTGSTHAPHSEETKQKMRDKRKLQTRTSQKSIVVFGITYNSLIDACTTLNRNYKYIIRRLRSAEFLDCYYL